MGGVFHLDAIASMAESNNNARSPRLLPKPMYARGNMVQTWRKKRNIPPVGFSSWGPVGVNMIRDVFICIYSKTRPLKTFNECAIFVALNISLCHFSKV
jgi:hypothetical protein